MFTEVFTAYICIFQTYRMLFILCLKFCSNVHEIMLAQKRIWICVLLKFNTKAKTF